MNTAAQNPSWVPASSRDRKILSIAILLLVIVAIVAAIAIPVILLHRHYDQNLSRMVRQLQTQSSFNAMRPQVTQALETLKTRDARKLFMKGATAALASAELQDMVKLVTETNGGRVLSVQGIAHKDDGPYRQVAATFQLNANNPNLRRILHVLETQEPYLFIDNLTVRSILPPGYRPQPGAVEPEVFIQMDVSGLAHIAAESVAAPAGANPPAPAARAGAKR